MNLLYRCWLSKDGSEKRVLDEIKRRNLFKNIITVGVGGETDLLFDGSPSHIKGAMCYNNEYERHPDWDSMMEVDGNLLELMLPYKDMCIQLFSIRQYDLYSGTYDDMELTYLKAIKFWNHILKGNEINLVFLPVLPHYGWEYALYAVAKCLKIPTLLLMQSHIREISAVGTSIETIGANTVEYMKSMQNIDHTELKKYVDEYQKKSLGSHSYTSDSEKKRQRGRAIALHYKKVYLSPLKRMAINILQNNGPLGQSIKRYLYAQEAQLDNKSIKYYKKGTSIACDRQYVYFALQLTPEATTQPWSGVFANQLVSIRLLATSLAELEVQLVVKEHWIQPCRPKTFYDELKKVPNTIFVAPEVDSYELIENCIAVATQTGSCITEAVLKRKPVISFVPGYWSGCENVFQVKNSGDIKKALRAIRNEKTDLSEQIAARYFSAIEHTMVRQIYDITDFSPEAEAIARADIADLIEEFCKCDANKEFFFFRKK